MVGRFGQRIPKSSVLQSHRSSRLCDSGFVVPAMSAFRWKVWLLMIFCNVRGQAFQAPNSGASLAAPGVVPVQPQPDPEPESELTRVPEYLKPEPEPDSEGIVTSDSSVPAIEPHQERDAAGSTIFEEFRTSHPYTVSLRRRLDMGYFCAGVVIGKRHVLTAAHCVDSSRTSADSRPLVVVGSASSSKTAGEGVQVISTQNVFIHPEFRSSRRPDLAILELERDAFQTPVRIPSFFRPQAGNSLLVIGWGRQSPFSQFSEVIQVSSMTYVPRRICALRRGSIISRHQICLGGQGSSSCEGDNGGPIVLPGRTKDQDILVGIIGDSHVCTRSRKPGVHTNITPFLHWIKSTAGIP